MIYVHTYLTDGFFEMTQVFLDSYEASGNPFPVAVDARGLSDEQELALCTHPSVWVVNSKPYDWADLERKTGTELSLLRRHKHQIEHIYVTPASRVWKLLFAGDDRVKAIRELLFCPERYQLFGGMRPSGLLHFDADTLFRGDISDLQELLSEFEIGLKLRPSIKPIKARITIDCVAIKPTPNARRFLDDWINIIDSVPPAQRPVGFGQSSCWQAFELNRRNLNFSKLPERYGMPGQNAANNVVWNGNKHNLAKGDCVKLFRNELKKMQEERT